MNEISAYIGTVIVIMLLRPVINGILPGKSMSKYINYVTGLIIITLLLLPFAKIDFSNIYEFDYRQQTADYENIEKDMIKNSVQSQLKKKFNAEYVEIEMDDKFNILSVNSDKKKMIEEYLGL